MREGTWTRTGEERLEVGVRHLQNESGALFPSWVWQRCCDLCPIPSLLLFPSWCPVLPISDLASLRSQGTREVSSFPHAVGSSP